MNSPLLYPVHIPVAFTCISQILTLFYEYIIVNFHYNITQGTEQSYLRYRIIDILNYIVSKPNKHLKKSELAEFLIYRE